MGVSNDDEDGGGVNGDGSGGGTSPSRQGAGIEIFVPQTRVVDGGGYETFRGWRLGVLGFLRRGQYIGKRATSVGNQGPHTLWWRGQGGART